MTVQLTHFHQDNTDGYSDEQLARANRIMDAWVSAHADEDGECDPNFYKTECERTLKAVEDHYVRA